MVDEPPSSVGTAGNKSAFIDGKSLRLALRYGLLAALMCAATATASRLVSWWLRDAMMWRTSPAGRVIGRLLKNTMRRLDAMNPDLMANASQLDRIFLMPFDERFRWTFAGWIIGLVAGAAVGFFQRRMVTLALFGGTIGALDMWVYHALSSGRGIDGWPVYQMISWIGVSTLVGGIVYGAGKLRRMSRAKAEQPRPPAIS
ncbi:MAG TPA: hypothetical protein VK395_37565 [Gemmataceae bacterium]|nr:hypothetical protein [Gemmataceae bacterium]